MGNNRSEWKLGNMIFRKNYNRTGEKPPSPLQLILRSIGTSFLILLDVMLIWSFISNIGEMIEDNYDKTTVLNWCEQSYDHRRWNDLYSSLLLYDPHTSDYDKYWEMVEFYQEYLELMEWEKMASLEEPKAGAVFSDRSEIEENQERILQELQRRMETTTFSDNQKNMRLLIGGF